MSATLAKDSRVRPNVFGSSTTHIVLSSRGPAPARPHAPTVVLACIHNRTSPPGHCFETQSHHIADHDRAGAAGIDGDAIGGEIVERAAPHLLFGPRPVDDDGRRRAARP